MVVRLISTAQTGYFYTTKRLRTGPKLAAVKYDPTGMLFTLSLFQILMRCTSKISCSLCWEQEVEEMSFAGQVLAGLSHLTPGSPWVIESGGSSSWWEWKRFRNTPVWFVHRPCGKVRGARYRQLISSGSRSRCLRGGFCECHEKSPTWLPSAPRDPRPNLWCAPPSTLRTCPSCAYDPVISAWPDYQLDVISTPFINHSVRKFTKLQLSRRCHYAHRDPFCSVIAHWNSRCRGFTLIFVSAVWFHSWIYLWF